MKDDDKKSDEIVGLDISATSSGAPVTGAEIVNQGGGIGADVAVTAPPGSSAIGVRSIVSGPGATGLRATQNGPGTALKIEVKN